MSLSKPSRPALNLLRAGAVSLVVGFLGSFWHFLASQSPSSPFYPGTLPGPVKRFAWWGLASGVLLPLSAWMLEVGRASDVRRRRLAVLMIAATVCKLAALLVGAVLGVYGVQVLDPRPMSVLVMSMRTLGDAAMLGCLLALARDLFRMP